MTRASPAREIYAFPSGLLTAQHCAELGQALAQLWPEPGLAAAVVLEPRSDPALPASELGARAYDDSQMQGVLSYASASELLAMLEPLFLNADPELFLLHRGPFADVVARAGEYAERELQLNRPLGASDWLERLSQSALCQHYAPLVVHRPDGRCFAIERAS